MADFKGKKVLLAEDEPTLSRVLALKLSNEGFEVKVANDGEQAVNTYKDFTPDLVLLDVMMPKMNGFEVLEELTKLNNKVPVIVISNLSQDEDIEKIKSLGAVDYLIKSNVPMAGIIEKIKEHLSK